MIPTARTLGQDFKPSCKTQLTQIHAPDSSPNSDNQGLPSAYPYADTDILSLGLVVNGFSNGYAAELWRKRYPSGWQMTGLRIKAAFNQGESTVRGSIPYEEFLGRLMLGVAGFGQRVGYKNIEAGYLLYPLGFQVHGGEQQFGEGDPDIGGCFGDPLGAEGCLSGTIAGGLIPVEVYLRYIHKRYFASIEASTWLVSLSESLEDDFDVSPPPEGIEGLGCHAFHCEPFRWCHFLDYCTSLTAW